MINVVGCKLENSCSLSPLKMIDFVLWKIEFSTDSLSFSIISFEFLSLTMAGISWLVRSVSISHIKAINYYWSPILFSYENYNFLMISSSRITSYFSKIYNIWFKIKYYSLNSYYLFALIWISLKILSKSHFSPKINLKHC